MAIKGIIFDLDGVLCFTDEYHYLAWKAVADGLSIPFDRAENHRLRGVSRMESLNIILEKAGRVFSDEEKAEIAQEKNTLYRGYLAKMTPSDIKPEVRETLASLRSRGYRLAIGSSSKNAGLILEKTGLSDAFDAVSDGNIICHSKPNPEVFLKAAEMLNLLPEECAVIEDATAGIEAAAAGGFLPIGIGAAEKDARCAHCLKTFSDLNTLFAAKVEKGAMWIHYPGDFEVWLAGKAMCQRYERDVIVPPIWRVDSHFQTVVFYHEFELKKPDEIVIEAQGEYNIQVDGYVYTYDFDGVLKLAEGKHSIRIVVHCQDKVPSIKAEGKELKSSADWVTTCYDNVIMHPAETKGKPDGIAFTHTEVMPVSETVKDGKIIYDFGRETMALVSIEGSRNGIKLHYGESAEEAQDFEHCELTNGPYCSADVRTAFAKAFRYIGIEEKYRPIKITAIEELLNITPRSEFSCDDALLNKIYEVSLRTLHLSTREFFLDGVKRDRWVWSGDAYQSYLMNYYSFFDKDSVRRTVYALFGKPPVNTHINTIMDYSFYWVMGVYDYYFYTGDSEFLEAMYGRVKQILNFCIDRSNENGLMEGKSGDWVFVDWANLDNSGEVAFEQMLYALSLKKATEMAWILSDKIPDIENDARRFSNLYEKVQEEIEKFWIQEKSAYAYSYKEGKCDNIITRHPNILAVLFNICGAERKKEICKRVLADKDAAPAILTPYMRFYELAALCEAGEFAYVLDEIRAYWGGMLALGATSFWEQYDASATSHYEMYGRPYGKSLCHAWGASPLYLIGRYLIGFRPLLPAYAEYEIAPQVELLGNFFVRLPSCDGVLEMENKGGKLRVIYTGTGKGRLKLKGNEYEIAPRIMQFFAVPC